MRMLESTPRGQATHHHCLLQTQQRWYRTGKLTIPAILTFFLSFFFCLRLGFRLLLVYRAASPIFACYRMSMVRTQLRAPADLKSASKHPLPQPDTLFWLPAGKIR